MEKRQRLERAAEAAKVKLSDLHGRRFKVENPYPYDEGVILGGHAWWHEEKEARKTYILFKEDGIWEDVGRSIPGGECTICVVTSRRYLDDGTLSEESFGDLMRGVAEAFVRGFNS